MPPQSEVGLSAGLEVSTADSGVDQLSGVLLDNIDCEIESATKAGM